MRDSTTDTTIAETNIGIQKDEFNPFPGLRPFSIEESHLFFGREGQSDEVISNLSKYRFAAVTGASGSGKSSLIYCGLIPQLYGGFIIDAGSKWRIITTRPGNSPIENLADAIAQNEIKHDKDNTHEFSKTIFLSVLKRSYLGLIDSLKQLKTAPDENILLIFDQFEELFRFKESRKDTSTINETEAYIKLIVETIKQKELPVYAVLTMRSDFVGECSQYHELTELINQSNYLIPQMTREDFRKAIEGPIAVGNAKIDNQLVQRLLNTVGNNTDQLSVLQHVLMRTWDHWSKYNKKSTPISSRNYESVGQMDRALSMHADEAYDELSPEGRRICEKLFKTLTERGRDYRGIRHPERIDVISNIASAKTDEVIEVVEKFRMKGRSFLTPSVETPLTKETVVDISHESLMRVWDRLKNWVEEEAQAVQMYLRLADASAMYQVGKAGLWRPPDLHLAVKWRQKHKPTLTWAKRYNLAFERAMVFLETSERKFKSEERNKIRLQKRALRRSQTFALVMGITSILFLGLLFYANDQRSEAVKQRKIAEELRKEAVQQKDVAVEKSIKAEEEKDVAELQKEIAEKERKQAELESQLLNKEKSLAEKREIEARLESEKALLEKQRAEMEKMKAVETAEEAEKEKTEAEKEKELEFIRRMRSISQSMAVKSLTTNDKNLRGLLAVQAYNYHSEYGGNETNNDIFSALYFAVKSFKGEDFNGLAGHQDEVKAITFEKNDNVFYSTGGDGKIIKWNFNGYNSSSRTIVNNDYINYSVAVSENGNYLACGTFESVIQLINLKSGANTILEGHSGTVSSLVFGKDNRSLYSIAGDKTVRKWNIATGDHTILDEMDTRIRCIDISPDGNTLAGGTHDGKLVIWNLDNNQRSDIYQNSSRNTIYTVAFNNTGSRIAIGDKQGIVKLFNARSKRIIANLKGHTGRINDVTFSPDDRFVASSSMDAQILIWDNKNLNEKPIIINDHESWVFSIKFSHDSKYLVSSSRNKNLVYVWPSRSKFMADDLCGLLNRNMTQFEWNENVAQDIEYEKTCPGIAE